jgi:AcrR family transcriptional regulator
MSPKVSNQYKMNKKQELLEAAKRVFIRKGYVHTTMQDIMNEADVSRGALYSYFNNIQHVFEELLKCEDEKDIHYLNKDSHQSFWQQLTSWIQLQKTNIKSINHSLLLCNTEFFLVTNYEENRANNPYVIERYKKLVNAIKCYIEAGIEKNECEPIMPSESIALYLVSLIDGLMLDTFNLGLEVTKVDEQIDILLYTLKKMLCPIIER